MTVDGPLAVVVLAGGQSSRFGSDKLQADLGDGRTLLVHALAALPASALVAVVGPERPLDRTAVFLREDPPGGGPAAALIAGLTWAIETGAAVIATLPGDAPNGGQAVEALTAALSLTPSPAGAAPTLRRTDPTRKPRVAPAEPLVAIAVDNSGRDQVLQLALNPAGARELIVAAGAGRGAGESVRRLLQAAAVDFVRVPVAQKLTADIDTVAQLRAFTQL